MLSLVNIVTAVTAVTGGNYNFIREYFKFTWQCIFQILPSSWKFRLRLAVNEIKFVSEQICLPKDISHVVQ